MSETTNENLLNEDNAMKIRKLPLDSELYSNTKDIIDDHDARITALESKIVVLSQNAYDELSVKDENVLYFISGE